MKDLKVTLECGIEVDFTGKLDEPVQYIGTLEEHVFRWMNHPRGDVRESSKEEIEKRAIEYAHKALSRFYMRARMADEAVRLLAIKLKEYFANNPPVH